MSESFEDAMVTVHKYRLLSDKMADRLQKAHDHDMEQRMREQYHRGYVAGQRSMDAEHYAVALKLRRLRFDGDSHANLSKLAYAIYPCATGWTCESCDGLRDELIRLMGGVHEPVPVGASGGAGCADCDCGAGESGRIAKLKEQRDEYKAWYEEYYEAYSRCVDDYNTVLLERNEFKLKLLEIKAIINASDKAHRDA